MNNRRRDMRYGVCLTAAASVALLAIWSYGCSSDSSSSSQTGLGQPDPGGTLGVEAMVRVIGAGRVSSDPGSVDCPGKCSNTFIFDPASATAKEITLTATASNGWKFAGWTFDAVDAPAPGRGPDSCQPVVRKTGTPQGDLSGNAVKLVAAEIDGTTPQGQSCSGYSKVPAAYSATATFVKIDTPPDGGKEDTPIYTCATGSIGRKLFLKNGTLFWQCDTSTQSTISYGSASSPGTASTFATGGLMAQFQIDPYSTYAVFQHQAGGLFAKDTVAPTSATTPLTGGPAICSAVTAEGANAYCRGSEGSLVRWSVGGMVQPLATGLPTGTDLAVDGTNAFFSGSQTSSVYALSLSSLDGGTAAPQALVGGQTAPNGLQLGANNAFWLVSGGLNATLKTGGSSTPIQSRAGIKAFAMDPTAPLGSTIYFLAVPSSATGVSSIERTSGSSGGAGTAVKTGLTNPAALAVDGTNVYWLSTDGRVFRAPK